MKIDVRLIEALACEGQMTFEAMQMVKEMAETLNRTRDIVQVQESLILKQFEEIDLLKRYNEELKCLVR